MAEMHSDGLAYSGLPLCFMMRVIFQLCFTTPVPRGRPQSQTKSFTAENPASFDHLPYFEENPIEFTFHVTNLAVLQENKNPWYKATKPAS